MNLYESSLYPIVHNRNLSISIISIPSVMKPLAGSEEKIIPFLFHADRISQRLDIFSMLLKSLMQIISRIK